MPTPDPPPTPDDGHLPDDQLEEVAGGGFWEDLKDWIGYPDSDNPTGPDD